MEPEFAPCKLIQYKDGWFGLLLTHFDAAESTFEAMGFPNNGHSWQSLVIGQVSRKLPEDSNRLEFDSEADMFVARSAERDVLERVAGLIWGLLADSTLLRGALSQTELD